MTLQEFKAWFEGYSESIEDAPTMKQWKRIKSRVTEINGVGTTKAVFVDRYWGYGHYPCLYGSNPYVSTCGPSSSQLSSAFQNANQLAAQSANNVALQNTSQGGDWNAQSAMSSLGVADGAADRQ